MATKKDYFLSTPIKLIWSGSAQNAEKIQKILPVLKNISNEYSIELILICPEKSILDDITVKHYQWNANTFYKLF